MALILRLLVVIVMLIPMSGYAQVHVKGYYRKDGTYVSPHIRSSPDAYKWNNYGPSSSSPLYTGKGSITPPSTRDNDGDGIANYLDRDDDGDGILDDYDSSQYSRGTSLRQHSTEPSLNSSSFGVSSLKSVTTSGSGSGAAFQSKSNSTSLNQIEKVKLARLKRNYEACSYGWPQCDKSLLDNSQEERVKAAALKRNHEACMYGWPQCDESVLTD